ncbi:MAG: TIGR00730 family Rossman fold protein [Holosporales bacterium]|nr:TIGR00730 family Rossman fold protein [Holosporales bacterium]
MIDKKPNSWELTQGETVFKDDFSLSEAISSSKDKRIAILGGSGIEKASEYYQKAVILAETISAAGISIITGGGPGIMEAGNKGAKSVKSTAFSYGLKVKSIKKEIEANNSYIHENCDFTFNTLSIRLLTLLSISDAIVFFPGGFGTLEELFSLLVRIRVDIMKKIPIYLFGSKFWKRLISWLDEIVKAEEVISEENLKLFKIEDDIEKISNEIISYFRALN